MDIGTTVAAGPVAGRSRANLAVRDPAASIADVLGLLYLLPLLAFMVSDPGRHRFLWSLAPMNAGLAVQTTVDVAGLTAVAGTAAVLGSALAGWLILRARDA
ncbi:hypothetical protein ACQEUU_20435 [Nonomuraea sp. CA-218870]|uniref:hypothetical protein n=1 Tax=Nonomuraea sp. CA-218870 TaxID=3239998 RepID=UPI003D9169AB